MSSSTKQFRKRIALCCAIAASFLPVASNAQPEDSHLIQLAVPAPDATLALNFGEPMAGRGDVDRGQLGCFLSQLGRHELHRQ